MKHHENADGVTYFRGQITGELYRIVQVTRGRSVVTVVASKS